MTRLIFPWPASCFADSVLSGAASAFVGVDAVAIHAEERTSLYLVSRVLCSCKASAKKERTDV